MNRRIALGVLLVLVVSASVMSAEARERRNLVGGELGGRPLLLSVNYERYLTDIFGAGIGIFGLSSSNTFIFIMPLYASATIGETHALYLSGGVTVIGGGDWDSPSDDVTTSYETFTVGYQYQADAGFYVRPTANFLLAEEFLVWPGIAIGGSF